MMTGPSGAASGAQRNCPGCRFWAVAAIEPSSSLAWANAGGIAKPNALIVAVASKERRVRCEAEPIVIQHLIHGTMRGQGMKQSRWKIVRSEEHTSELQSLMRISYAVFCLKKKTQKVNKETSINK